MGIDPRELRARVDEEDLLDWRNFRIQTTQNWKNRLKRVDKLYRGDWDEVFPDESAMRENPHVMNMVQVGLDDVAKLVSEAVPSVRCLPSKDTQDGEDEAIVRNAIADTYWEVNDGETLIPRFAMDIAGAGLAVCVGYVDGDSEYPMLHRVDPRFAYPDIVNGKLLDLLVVEEMNIRSAARLFPHLGLDKDPTITSSKVEILHYYSKEECLQAVLCNPENNGRVDIVRRWYPDCLTVAFVQLDSFDGQIRGMFDQITGSLETKNRIVKQMLDYTDQQVYAPMIGKGLLNPEDAPGPATLYRLDPNVPDAQMGRMAPAGSNPQLFGILDYLDREQRGAASYPAARQGEVSQSIASASFVASTQGQLTSTVRNIQRLLGSLRQQLNTIMFALDEKYLDNTKPLYRPVGKKKMYSPSRDIGGNYKNMVLYGAGAGLDRLNADVRIMQLLGAGIISLDDAREQIDFIKNPDKVAINVELQQTQAALMQKFLSEAPLDLLAQVMALQSTGLTLVQAVEQIRTEQAANQPAPTEPAAAPVAGAPGENPDAAMQAQALQAGGIPSGTATTPEFAPQPLEQIIVK